jgi:mono/diheme cytochrome c family protein
MLMRLLARLIVLVGILALAGAAYVRWFGIDARAQPGPVETRLARAIRGVAIRAVAGQATNPVPLTQAVLTEGREHFADHCAVCHGNDGGGQTDMGRGLYPKAPDMRLPATQDLSDAELFYIIENGIRFTGMPGWSTGTKEGETASWHLVHFIRHLPAATADEVEQMRGLNPRSPAEVRQEIEAERFLAGEIDAPPSPSAAGEHEH